MKLRHLSQIVRSVVTIHIVLSALQGQSRDEHDLARQLASRETRSILLRTLVPGNVELEQTLLRILERLPENVEAHELKVGLADAFGLLRTKKAVPFLIKNVSMERWGDMNTTLKSPAVIAERWPAASALIQIGPYELDELFRVHSEGVSLRDRMAIVFVISRIPDRRCRAFLTELQTEESVTGRWVAERLAEFDRNH